MEKNILSLLASFFCLVTGVAQAGILVTTGTTAQGYAFITVPTVKFTITSNVSGGTLGSTLVSFDIRQVWSSNMTIHSALGSGLTFFTDRNPSASIGNWQDYSGGNSPYSSFDSLLMAAVPTTTFYSVGETVTLEGGTFTATNQQAGFTVFPSGVYDIAFVVLSGSGAVTASTLGVAVVPEPGILALLALAGFLPIYFFRRKISRIRFE